MSTRPYYPTCPNCYGCGFILFPAPYTGKILYGKLSDTPEVLPLIGRDYCFCVDGDYHKHRIQSEFLHLTTGDVISSMQTGVELVVTHGVMDTPSGYVRAATDGLIRHLYFKCYLSENWFKPL